MQDEFAGHASHEIQESNACDGDGHLDDETQDTRAVPNLSARESGADDRIISENQDVFVVSQPKRKSQWRVDTQPMDALAGDDGAQKSVAFQVAYSPIIAEIRQLWRIRQSWHRAEKSLTLQGKARCRAWTEGDKEAANKLFDLAAKGQPVDPTMAIVLEPFLQAIGNFEPKRKAFEKRMCKLAKSLLIAATVAKMKGFGPNNLAALIGEAGDIGLYRNPSCLWKRMGMAVIDGGRQRKCVDEELALLHGYNPSRRAVAYVIGECLIKAGGDYRRVYDERRAHTAGTHPDWTPKHSHNDALRIMTKRALRDLWIAWRALAGEVNSGVETTRSLPLPSLRSDV